MYRVSPFVRHFAWALLGGAGLATVWVNLDPASYYDAVEYRLIDLAGFGALAGDGLVVTPILVVTDLLMAFFMFFVGKELWEALILDRGALSGRRASWSFSLVSMVVPLVVVRLPAGEYVFILRMHFLR